MPPKFGGKPSKFKHAVTTPAQLRDCFQDIHIGNCAPESYILKSNSKYFALPWVTAGSLYVSPLTQVGAVNVEDVPLFIHDDASSVVECALHQFNEDIAVTAHQDGHVLVWQIPDGGLHSSTTSSIANFEATNKRALDVMFHPYVNSLLAVICSDQAEPVSFFDLETQQLLHKLPASHKGIVTDIAWNDNGSICATVCKDKKLRKFDPRANKMIEEVECHPGAKASRVFWCHGRNNIITIGHGRSNRELALFDSNNLAKGRLQTESIDNNSASLMAHYDQDLGLLVQTGKGDGVIKFWELDNNNISCVGQYTNKDPSSGMCWLRKTLCDVKKCEVTKFLKLTPNKQIIPHRIEVPRANMDFFQDDLFPDTYNYTTNTSALDWSNGANPTINRISLAF